MHGGNMEIRKAKECDIDGILNLLIQVDMVHHHGRPDLFNGPATKYTKEELIPILHNEHTPVFVAVDGSQVLGHAFCILETHEDSHVLADIKTLYVDDICVDEKERGRHVGRSLYEFVENYARSIGCHNITLNVWECNPTAKNFYKAMGMHVQKTGMEKIL